MLKLYTCIYMRVLSHIKFSLQQLLPTSLTTDNISPTVDNDANKDSDTTAAADSLGPAGKSTTTLALTAIPIEVKQGEEQPSSAASPLHTLPSVSQDYTETYVYKFIRKIN